MHRTNEIMVGIRLVDEAPTITAYRNDPRLRAITHEMGKGRGRPVALGPFRYRHPIGAVPLRIGQARADRRPEIDPITDIVGRADGDVQVGEGYPSADHSLVVAESARGQDHAAAGGNRTDRKSTSLNPSP